MAGKDTGYVYYRADVPQADLEALLKKQSEHLKFIIQEREADIAFDEFGTLGTPWPAGRAFGLRLEVRWTSQGDDACQVWLLTEDPSLVPAGEGWQRYQMTAVAVDKIYLWGRHLHWLEGAREVCDRLPHVWVEARTPIQLRYPLEKHEFAFLEGYEYQQNGIARLTRFSRLSGESREEVKP